MSHCLRSSKQYYRCTNARWEAAVITLDGKPNFFFFLLSPHHLFLPRSARYCAEKLGIWCSAPFLYFVRLGVCLRAPPSHHLFIRIEVNGIATTRVHVSARLLINISITFYGAKLLNAFSQRGSAPHNAASLCVRARARFYKIVHPFALQHNAARRIA